MKAIVIAAASGVGKTTVSAAIMGALTARATRSNRSRSVLITLILLP